MLLRVRNAWEPICVALYIVRNEKNGDGLPSPGRCACLGGPEGPAQRWKTCRRSIPIPKGYTDVVPKRRLAASARRMAPLDFLGVSRYAGSKERNELRRSRKVSSPEEVCRKSYDIFKFGFKFTNLKF